MLCFDMDVDRGRGNWKLGEFAVDQEFDFAFQS